MFHVKHLFLKLRSIPIIDLVFYLFLISLPFQLRTIVSHETAFIDYYFSYHKAVFFYLSDILLITLVVLSVSKKQSKVYLAIFLPIIWLFVSLFHVEHKDLVLYYSLKTLGFFFIVAFIASNPRVKTNTFRILVYSGLLQAIIGISQYFFQSDINLRLLGEYVPHLLDSGAATVRTESETILRAYGTMPHPNVLGGFLAISLAILFYVSRGTKHTLTRYMIVSCETYILLWGLLVSYSRSAWLSVALLSIIFITYQLHKNSLTKAVLWSLLLLVSCGTLAWFHSEKVFPRLADSTTQSQAIAYRDQFNSWGLSIAKQNWLVGVGPGQYIPTLETKFHVEPWAYQPPHNVLLMIWAEIGVIGILLAILSLYLLGFTWNIIKTELFWFIAPVIFIISSLDHYLITIQQGYLLLAVCLGLLIANKRDVSQSRETSI